jgi:hypothetical protein
MLAGGVSLWLNSAVRTGTSWSVIKAAVGSNKISAIAVAQGNSAIIWVGHNDGSVYRTANGTDASPTWNLVSNGSSGTAQGRIVSRIVIDKDDPTKVYVSYGGYNNNNLWLGTNNGTTWTDLNSLGRVLPSVPIFGFARHQLNASWLYAGTEVGLFTSQDGGTTWSTSNDGPANVEIADLAWRDNTTLIAATHGRGMFLMSSCGTQPVKNYDTSAYYWTIQSAQDAAGSGNTIEMHAGDFGEDLTLVNANPVIMRGGYSCDYSANSAFTNVHGKVIVKGGRVIMDKIVIK